MPDWLTVDKLAILIISLRRKIMGTCIRIVVTEMKGSEWIGDILEIKLPERGINALGGG